MISLPRTTSPLFSYLRCSYLRLTPFPYRPLLVLESGERVEYAALVLGTGSSWTGTTDFPDADEDVREHIRSWRAAFSKASNVVIVGGGAVGIGEYRLYASVRWLTSGP